MIISVAIFAFLSLASASDVLDLTDANFASKIADQDVVLVEFFAPWCGHCKRLAPEYEKAATTLKSNDPPVPLAKVDCTENTEICGKHGVSGYPTLKIFRNGEFSEDYNGAREADGIVKTMRSKAGPASKELKTVADAEKFVASSEYGIIGFFSSEDNDAAKTFQKVATSMNSEMRFAHSYNEDINKKYAVNDDIVLFQPKRLQSKFEDAQRKYNDDMTVFKVKNWISANSQGLCGHRTTDNADKFSKPTVVAYYDVDYVKNVKGTNYWRNRVMKVAKKFQDAGKTVTFAVSSSTDFAQELAEFGIEGASGDKPVVAGRDSKNQKFVMSDEFSMDNLEKFVNDLLDGKLEAYMKSEAVPDNTQNAVKVAVAKNFAEVVSEDKDVLIEFYAPWCGHCKQLEPKYTELAEKLADESEVVIAKMDATANDVPPQFEVQGFPTIFFKPKGSPPKKYQGGREVDDFVKYLAKEASTELNSYTRDGKKKKAAKKVEL
ncbi:protein disulfide-isomerase A3-like [Mya arenaria]|uniref:protein disulfide-isomerase A3-like n=1 Tax=Mya arenaria TaxID=6604 RepID=UPI0022E1C7E4|nr:protein disulfide-isomerase A3-like [Mya arenaria]